MLAAAGHRPGRDADAHALVALLLSPATRTRGVRRRSERPLNSTGAGNAWLAASMPTEPPGDRRVDAGEAKVLLHRTGDVDPVADVYGRRPAVKDEQAVRRVGIVVAPRGRGLDEEAAGPTAVTTLSFVVTVSPARGWTARGPGSHGSRGPLPGRARPPGRPTPPERQPPATATHCPASQAKAVRSNIARTASPRGSGTSSPCPTRCP